MLRHRSLVLLCALVSCAASLEAQAPPSASDSAGVVVGRVRAWLDGAPIARAIVDAQSPLVAARRRAAAISDSVGWFRLHVPAAGAYLLRARAIGWGVTAQVPVHLAAGDSVYLDLFLPPAGFDPAERERQLAELAGHRARWESTRPAAYRASISWECFCLTADVGEWALEVRADTTVVRAKPPRAGPRPPFPTVDSVFAWLESELRDPSRWVEVRYDASLGFPIEVRTDATAPITDTWTHIRIRELSAARPFR